MAAVSRIISLPSATQYNPVSPPYPSFTYNPDIPFLTPFSWGEIPYNGNPTNSIRWTVPVSVEGQTYFYKNQQSEQYRFILTRVDDGVVIRDGLLGLYGLEPLSKVTTNLGSGLVAGTKYTVSTYTLANGTRSGYSSNWTFRAMTLPESSPTSAPPYSGYGTGGYANSIFGNTVNLVIATTTTNWGGASADQIDLERFYDIQLLNTNGSVAYSAPAYAYGDESTGAPYSTLSPNNIEARYPGQLDGTGGVGPEELTVWVRARNLAGAAPRNQNAISAQYGPAQLFNVAPPYASSLLPSSGSGAGGYSLIIDGYYLHDTREVTIGGLNAVVLSNTFNRLVVNVPPNTTGSAGAKDIVITTNYEDGTPYTVFPKFTYTTFVPGPYFPYFGPPVY